MDNPHQAYGGINRENPRNIRHHIVGIAIVIGVIDLYSNQIDERIDDGKYSSEEKDLGDNHPALTSEGIVEKPQHTKHSKDHLGVWSRYPKGKIK